MLAEIPSGDFKLVIKEIEQVGGWIVTRAWLINPETEQQDGVVEWRAVDTNAVWGAGHYEIRVSSMANAHVTAARDYLKRRIANDEWIFAIDMNTTHNQIVVLALKGVRRLERWRAWIASFDYELKQRGR